eukprot:COSAG01_NODE_18416_length_1077_cov_2.260736_1_plen_103_part_01
MQAQAAGVGGCQAPTRPTGNQAAGRQPPPPTTPPTGYTLPPVWSIRRPSRLHLEPSALPERRPSGVHRAVVLGCGLPVRRDVGGQVRSCSWYMRHEHVLNAPV